MKLESRHTRIRGGIHNLGSATTQRNATRGQEHFIILFPEIHRSTSQNPGSSFISSTGHGHGHLSFSTHSTPTKRTTSRIHISVSLVPFPPSLRFAPPASKSTKSLPLPQDRADRIRCQGLRTLKNFWGIHLFIPQPSAKPQT